MTVRDREAIDYSKLGLTEALEALAQRDEQIAILVQRVRQLEKMYFGPRSSKRREEIDPRELLPFPHLAELLRKVEERAQERTAAAESVNAKSSGAPDSGRPKQKPKRRSLENDIPERLPRVRREAALPTTCGCNGLIREIREEVTRKLDKLTVHFVDERVIKYGSCTACEKVHSSAPESDSVIDGGMLGAGMCADVVFQRFANHVPYHRMEQEMLQLGIPVSRTVLGRTALTCGELLLPVYEAIRRAALSEFLIDLDATPVVVRNGAAPGRKIGRIWVYRAQSGHVFFDFQMDRSSKGPLAVLGEYRGFVQGDAYSGHDCLFRDTQDRTELGCWSHVVRKFDDGKSTSKRLSKEFSVLSALLFRVETEARSMSPPERFELRWQHATPILNEIKDWLDARQSTVAPKSSMGKAISYSINHWSALKNYLLDGRILDITNNGAERALRRVAVGRKNWIFVGTEEAGTPAAVLMSVLQTCREQGVNAIEYLRDVLPRMKHVHTDEEADLLTPLAWQRDVRAQAATEQRREKLRETIGALEFTR